MTFLPKSFKSVNHSEAGCAPALSSAGPSGKLYALSEPVRTAHLDQFDQIGVSVHPDEAIYWGFMRPRSRPCFTRELLLELRKLQDSVRLEFEWRRSERGKQLRYFVFGSHAPGVFNLGGDLGLFVRLIRAGEREALQNYAHVCIDAVYDQAISLDLPIITIALVQGDALGGGFEAALSCNLIVAEKSAKFGLPEVLFNLFPGMGAYNFLARRMHTASVEKLILSGRIYSAEEMHAMGIVDILAEDGLGEEAVRDYVDQHSRRAAAEQAIYAARQIVQPVRLADLRTLADLWVDTALALTEADLRRIERLSQAQDRREVHRKPIMVAAE